MELRQPVKEDGKMFEVVYYPMCGTKKCDGIRKTAEAIAAELGVKAEDTQTKKEMAKDSFVLLGCDCYASKERDELQEFIDGMDFDSREVALFGTSWNGSEVAVKVMEEMLKPRGVLIVGSFHCQGHISILLRPHPNKKELKNAREFARKMKGHWEKHISLRQNARDS